METINSLEPTTIDRLNDLIRCNIDSARGLREAAAVINDGSVRSRLEALANQRDGNAAELKKYVQWNHEEPDERGSLAGTLHRWWLDLRAKIAGGDAKVVLAEAERGEDMIKSDYERALRDIAGSPLNDLLQRQYLEVKRAHDSIRNLRNSLRAA